MDTIGSKPGELSGHDVRRVLVQVAQMAVGAGLTALADNLGGLNLGPWQPVAMTKRTIDKGNVTGDSTINFFITPDYIADYYFAKVIGYRNVLLDYYIEAVDSRGNITKTDIQHVWVADDGTVAAPPATPQNLVASPVNTNQINLAWNAANGATSYIVRRGGSVVGNTSATGFNDTGLLANTPYC